MTLENTPHFLKVEVTQEIRDFLRACIGERGIGDKVGERTREEVERILLAENADTDGEKFDEIKAELKFRTLEKVFNLYRESEDLSSTYFAEKGRIYLHKLMQGSDVYFTPPYKPPRNPQLVKRLAKIQQRLDNQEYNRMVSNLTEKKRESLAIDMKSLNIQTVHAFNILLSFVCAFAFGFAVGYLCEMEHTYSALIGVLLCVPVLLADVYFLLKSYEDGVERVEDVRGGVIRLGVKHE